MNLDNKNKPTHKEEGKLPPAETGNASNPSPNNDELEYNGTNQLLDKKAEKYLRESANIEDTPDAQEQQEAEKTMDADSQGT